MKLALALVLVTAAFTSAPADARKDCTELKSEIASRIDAKGVLAYTLNIVDADASVEGEQVVGSCNGGRQRIVYQRTSKPSSTLVASEPR